MPRKSAPKTSKTPAKGLSSVTSPAQGTEAIETPIATTAVRKTVAPKAASPAAKQAALPITHERIAERAYYISQSGTGSSEDANWHRAEAELRSESL
jgi:hypothetical protein